MKAEGKYCRCIRCREIGSARPNKQEAILVERVYDGSSATEIFLSFETPDKTTIFGFLRLRIQKLSRDDLTFPELEGAGLGNCFHHGFSSFKGITRRCSPRATRLWQAG